LIAQQFRLGEERWESEYRVFYEELHKQLFSKDDLLNLFNYLIYHLHKETSELTQNFQDIWALHTLPRLHDALRLEDTLKGLYRHFGEILRDSEAKMNSIRQNDNRFHFIKKVKGHIEEYYADPNLSLSQISDVFRLSPSYLSRLFKEELGEKFIDYVTQVRINHAKRFLEDTNNSIQDIALKVGYVNALTFIRVFKKLTGETPGSFRKK
jgi:YesN/AraC family two-component response regulator